MASLPSAPRRRPGATSASVFRALETAYADHTWHWMPDAAGPMEIIAGAVLVQHTSWVNAERALSSLHGAGALEAAAVLSMAEADLARLLRAGGAPSVKARRLRAIAQTIVDAGGIEPFLALPLADLRALLLATHGIGPETADAIALYAAGRPSFVVDAYTRRLFRRIGLGPAADGYDAWQRFFEHALATDPGVDEGVEVYRRYHAYIVLHAKAVCRPVPQCSRCTLRPQCSTGLAAG